MFIKYTTGGMDLLPWICATAAAHTVFDECVFRRTFPPASNIHIYIYIYIVYLINKWHACPGSYKEVFIVGKLVGTSQLISSESAGKPSEILIAYIKSGSGSLIVHQKAAIC